MPEYPHLFFFKTVQPISGKQCHGSCWKRLNALRHSAMSNCFTSCCLGNVVGQKKQDVLHGTNSKTKVKIKLNARKITFWRTFAFSFKTFFLLQFYHPFTVYPFFSGRQSPISHPHQVLPHCKKHPACFMFFPWRNPVVSFGEQIFLWFHWDRARCLQIQTADRCSVVCTLLIISANCCCCCCQLPSPFLHNIRRFQAIGILSKHLHLVFNGFQSPAHIFVLFFRHGYKPVFHKEAVFSQGNIRTSETYSLPSMVLNWLNKANENLCSSRKKLSTIE